MVIAPLIERELKRALTKRWPHRLRSAVALGAGFLAYLTLVSSTTWPMANGPGRWLFFALGSFLVTLSALIGPAFTSLAFEQERTSKMLDLLLISDVGAKGLVFAKLVSHTTPILQAILSCLPVLALPIIVGGIDGGEIMRMSLLCLATLLLSSVAGVFASSRFESGKSAVLFTATLLTLVLIAPYWLDRVLSGSSHPIYYFPGLIQAFSCCSEIIYRIAPHTYWATIQAMGVLSVGLLLLSTLGLKQAVNLPVNCQTVAPSATKPKPHSNQSRRSNGRAFQRFLQRRQWHPLPITLAWLGITFMILAALDQQTFFRLPRNHLYLVVVPLLTHGFTKILLAGKSNQLVSRCRNSGELEILLSTPLRVGRICRGFFSSTLRAFLPIAAMVVVGDVLILAYSATSITRQGQDLLLWVAIWSLIVMMVLDGWAVLWISLWQGCHSRNLIQALWKTLRLTLIYPAALFVATIAISPTLLIYASTVGDDSLVVGAILWWWIISLAVKAPLAFMARNSLSNDFRQAVAGDLKPKRKITWLSGT